METKQIENNWVEDLATILETTPINQLQGELGDDIRGKCAMGVLRCAAVERFHLDNLKDIETNSTDSYIKILLPFGIPEELRGNMFPSLLDSLTDEGTPSCSFESKIDDLYNPIDLPGVIFRLNDYRLTFSQIAEWLRETFPEG